MLDTDDLRFFAAIAAAPSLTAAARALDVSPLAVMQRLCALERRLGLHLVDRPSRRLTLTDEGELLAEFGRDLNRYFAELDDALAARRGQVSGHLHIVAPLGFRRRYVARSSSASGIRKSGSTCGSRIGLAACLRRRRTL